MVVRRRDYWALVSHPASPTETHTASFVAGIPQRTENTGETLTPHLVSTLAEPFQRGTRRIRTDHAGVGLGLVDRPALELLLDRESTVVGLEPADLAELTSRHRVTQRGGAPEPERICDGLSVHGTSVPHPRRRGATSGSDAGRWRGG